MQKINHLYILTCLGIAFCSLTSCSTPSILAKLIILTDKQKQLCFAPDFSTADYDREPKDRRKVDYIYDISISIYHKNLSNQYEMYWHGKFKDPNFGMADKHNFCLDELKTSSDFTIQRHDNIQIKPHDHLMLQLSAQTKKSHLYSPSQFIEFDGKYKINADGSIDVVNE